MAIPPRAETPLPGSTGSARSRTVDFDRDELISRLDETAERVATRVAAIERKAGGSPSDNLLAGLDSLRAALRMASRLIQDEGLELSTPDPIGRQLQLRLREALSPELVQEEQEAVREPESLVRLLLTLDRALLLALDRVRRAVVSEVGEAGDASSDLNLQPLAELAHDLRSPLASILTLADALWRGQSGPVNHLQRRQLGLIYGAALGMSTAVTNMSELWNRANMTEELGPFSITTLLESVRDIVLPLAEEKGLTLRLEASGADQRLGHALMLSRVLLNLTTNALKFTERGYVELGARATTGIRVLFWVRDTGPGISPEGRLTLFAPVRGTAGRGLVVSGTGLGLALCRKLVSEMGSTLQLESQLGKGTRFFFEIDSPAVPPAPL